MWLLIFWSEMRLWRLWRQRQVWKQTGRGEWKRHGEKGKDRWKMAVDSLFFWTAEGGNFNYGDVTWVLVITLFYFHRTPLTSDVSSLQGRRRKKLQGRKKIPCQRRPRTACWEPSSVCIRQMTWGLGQTAGCGGYSQVMQCGETWKRDQKLTTARQQTFEPLDTMLLSLEQCLATKPDRWPLTSYRY